MMVGLLVAVRTGGNFSCDLDWAKHPGAKTPRTGELFMGSDPGKGAGQNFARRTETLVQRRRAAGQARQPGDRRYQQRAESERHGIAIDSEELARLRSLAAAPQPPAG